MSIFTAASAMQRNFSRNCKLPAYVVALAMNIKVPNTAAVHHAVQVHGSTSFDSRDTELSREAIPSNRKSTMAIEPNTMVNAMTCSVSTIGNSHSVPGISPRSAAEIGQDSMVLSKCEMFM